MHLRDIYRIINNKYSNLTNHEQDQKFIDELKSIINKGIIIKVTEQEAKNIIDLDYRYNKTILSDEIYKLIKDNDLDEYKLLSYLEK